MAGIYRDKNQEFLREPTSIANMVRAFNEFLGTVEWQTGPAFSGVRTVVDVNVVATTVNQDLNFTAVEDFDDGDWYDNGVSTTNVVVPTGVTRVMIVGQVTWAGDATGERRLRIEINGVNVGDARVVPAGTLAVNQQVIAIIDVVATDVITLAGFQNISPSGNLNITQGFFAVTKLG